MSLTIKKWSEITALILGMLFVTGTLAYLGQKAAMLQEQVIRHRAEIIEYREYVRERDAAWAPHILALPTAGPAKD